MASEIVMNITERETRLALIENGQVAEIHLERTGERGIVGNIYKGRVIKVLPGMQAAFVDIGLPRAAFLYVGDIYHHVQDLNFMVNEEETEESEEVGRFYPRRHSRAASAVHAYRGPPAGRGGHAGPDFQGTPWKQGRTHNLAHIHTRASSRVHAHGGPHRNFAEDRGRG